MLGIKKCSCEKKTQRRETLNYLGYKIDLQKIQPQKIQIQRYQLQILNDFQKLLVDTNWIEPTITLTIQALSNLFQTYEVLRNYIVQENYQLRLRENWFWNKINYRIKFWIT